MTRLPRTKIPALCEPQRQDLPMNGGLKILALQLSVHVFKGRLRLAVIAYSTLIYLLPVP
jgi:hypothetical protein